MKLIYDKDFCPEFPNMYGYLNTYINWIDAGAPRKEAFMSKVKRKYTYGRGRGERTYTSSTFPIFVEGLMDLINSIYKTDYDVCFANMYPTQKDHLGWHADDSPEQDMDHPIAVVSFGAEREIYWKHKDQTGKIPDDQKQLLENGSLFIMPAGFQADHLHKIPKHSAECSGRISLTFRKWKDVDTTTTS